MSLLDTTFTVEDGTGLSEATSYVSVTQANAYLANVFRPNLDSYSAETDAQIQTYLNSATLFIDQTYCFTGEKLQDTQALQFPRSGQSEVPLNVKYACIEVSLLIKNAKIYTNPGGETTGKVIERRVGPITTKFAQSTGKSPASGSRQVNLLKFVDQLLYPYLSSLPGAATSFQRG